MDEQRLRRSLLQGDLSALDHYNRLRIRKGLKAIQACLVVAQCRVQIDKQFFQKGQLILTTLPVSASLHHAIASGLVLPLNFFEEGIALSVIDNQAAYLQGLKDLKGDPKLLAKTAQKSEMKKS